MRGILTLLALSVIAQPALGQDALPRVLREVRFDQRLNEQVPSDLTFRDEAGQTVQLGDYFGDRPVILVLAYFKCPMLCTQVLNGLVQTLIDVPLRPGRDFTILTVSFDPRETPELAAAMKKTYVERLGRPEAAAGWHFLTGQPEAIARLTRAVGFQYTYDEQRDQYAHASGLVLLTPTGKVSRYFYDIRYSPGDLRLGLVEASANRIGSAVDQILLYCFHYDPEQGRYGPTIMNLVRLGGVFTLLCVGGFFALLWRQERLRSRRPAGQSVTVDLPTG